MKTLLMSGVAATIALCSLILFGSFAVVWIEDQRQTLGEIETDDSISQQAGFEADPEFGQESWKSELLYQRPNDVYADTDWQRQQEQWRIEEQVNEDMHRWEFYRSTRF